VEYRFRNGMKKRKMTTKSMRMLTSA